MSASQRTRVFAPTAPGMHLDQAAIGRLAAVRADALVRDDRRRVRRGVDDLRAGVLVLAFAGKRHRENLAARAFAHQIDRRILHRQARADVAVDPLDRRVLVRDRALGDEVEDVAIPVLDRRVADRRAFHRDQFDDRRVQRRRRELRRGAALDVVHLRAFVGDDQRALELAHVLGVDAEVGLQRHRHFDARRHVDERAARPHGRVERGELVVAGRNDRREILRTMSGYLLDGGVHVAEEHALRRRAPCSCCGRRLRTRTARKRRTRNLRSASGMPRRSNVRLMSSGTSSHERSVWSVDFTK